MAAIVENYTNSKPNTVIKEIRASVLKARFLEIYELTGSIAETCRLLGMVPRTFYHWRKNDIEFKANWDEANENALTLLEDEAHRRAVRGVNKPVYQNGRLVGFITEYSDTLLLRLMQAKDPKKYGNKNTNELTGPDGKPLDFGGKVIHVHSPVPLADSEEAISDVPYAVVVQNKELPPAQSGATQTPEELLNAVK